MNLKRVGVSLFFVVGCAGAPEAASTVPTEPAAESGQAEAAERESVSRALELYAAEDYDAAATAFAEAYAEDPDASLLFARAQSLRLAGQCAEARVLYDQFLAGSTDPTQRNAVQQLADDCAAPGATPAADDTQVAAR